MDEGFGYAERSEYQHHQWSWGMPGALSSSPFCQLELSHQDWEDTSATFYVLECCDRAKQSFHPPTGGLDTVAVDPDPDTTADRWCRACNM